MKESTVLFSNTLEVISCSFLNCLWAPVCTNISENLSTSCKKFHEHHSKSVENVVLCSKDVWLTSSVPVERCIQNCLCEVSVRIEVCPLSLSLESSCQSVVSDCFLWEFLVKVFISVHKVFDDNCHLNNELELLLFLLWRSLKLFWVLIPTNLASLFCPFKSFLELSLIIDSLWHTTDDFHLVNRLYTHSKVRLDEIRIDDRSTDTHCNRSNLKVRCSSHGCCCNSCTSESEKFLFNVFRNCCVVSFLNVMSVNSECRKSLLCMCSKYRCKVYSSRSLCSVESPYSFDCLWIHIHCLSSVAPARCNCNCDIYAFSSELISTSSALTYTSDCCVSDNNFNRLTIWIS